MFCCSQECADISVVIPGIYQRKLFQFRGRSSNGTCLAFNLVLLSVPGVPLAPNITSFGLSSLLLLVLFYVEPHDREALMFCGFAFLESGVVNCPCTMSAI